MIAYVKGTLEELEQDAALIDVGGLGYRVYTPVSEELIRRGIGSEVRLYTYLNVREDAMVLYGFLEKSTLSLFEQLISVTGVGPRSALMILSTLSPQQVISAVISDDKKTLSSVSGIGAKTASRIILDLKDKVGKIGITSEDPGFVMPQASVQAGPYQEAVEALVSLGFSGSEASRAVSKVTASSENLSLEDIIRGSLKLLY